MVTLIEEQIRDLSEAQLDAFPLGIVRLDRNATILYYNPSQAQLTRRDPETTIGKNFFRDVAPCAAVKGFQGRFDEFVAGRENRIEPFEFIFRFTWGTRRVKITMVRREDDDESFYLVVAAETA